MKKKKKKIYGMIMACLMGVSVFSSAQSANAASLISTQVLDNDDGGIDSTRNMRTGTWTRVTSTSDYRGDARRAATGSGAEYAWKFNYHSGQRLFYVYLNDINFNNKLAEYSVIAGDYTGYTIKTFNQQSAPGGWNLLTNTYNNDNVSYPYLSVWAVGGSTGYTGADGAEVDYYQ